MTIKELRDVTPKDTVLWIETEQEEYIESGENEYLSYKHDDKRITKIYPEYYKALCVTGITVHV